MSSHHEKIIEIQDLNLFDLPVQNTDLDNLTNEDLKTQMGGGNHESEDMDKKMDQIRDYAINEAIETVNINSMTGGGESSTSDPELFDNITLVKEENVQEGGDIMKSRENIEFTDSILSESQESNHENKQSGGGDTNLEELDISDINVEKQIDMNGNLDNPEEDAPDADDNGKFDEQLPEEQESQSWIHPELNLEEDPDMIVKMNQDEIETKVNIFLENYNSTEYQQYLKYFQAIYSASSQKYSIRRDNEGNIYLTKRIQKEVKGKKVRESVYDIINDTEYKNNYLIKLTPPEYVDVKEEILKITKELNILSGDIKVLQSDLIELGSDINKDDIRKFEKTRQKFYKLINKKYIYSKYLDQVNGIFEEEPKHNIYAKEIITDTDENDIKIYKLKYHVVGVSDDFINATTTQIKNNLDNYVEIINDDGNDQKEYNTKIKNFIKNKIENETKIKNELNGLVTLSKSKINLLIKKLPKVDIKTDIL
jgi:hypothetical protein